MYACLIYVYHMHAEARRGHCEPWWEPKPCPLTACCFTEIEYVLSKTNAPPFDACVLKRTQKRLILTESPLITAAVLEGEFRSHLELSPLGVLLPDPDVVQWESICFVCMRPWVQRKGFLP